MLGASLFQVNKTIVFNERSISVSKPSKKAGSPSAREKAGKRNPAAPLTKENAEAESVDKIRDILFGNQMRDYEKRFSRLEERLLNEIKELREATGKQLESIDAFIKKEIELLNQQLKSEQEQRVDAAKALSEDLESNIRTALRRIEKLDEKQSKDSQDLRRQHLDQAKSLSDQIRKKHQEFSRSLQNDVAELRADKVDRSALSQLFVQLAVRMSDELADKLNAEMGDLKND